MSSIWTHTLIVEIIIRIVLFVVFCVSEGLEPRWRHIHKEEWWLYSNPTQSNYVPGNALWALMIAGAFILTLHIYNSSVDKNKAMFRAHVKIALLGYSLALLLNGCITNCLKLAVGRPRPDYRYRCWPQIDLDVSPADLPSPQATLECTGDHHALVQGRKSFPSGHSSFCFAAGLYITLHLFAHFRLFARGELFVSEEQKFRSCLNQRNERPQAWRLILSLLPVCLAAMVAVSRLIDYHHHAEDIAVGSALGLFCAWICYRLYYPPLTALHCDTPLEYSIAVESNNSSCV